MNPEPVCPWQCICFKLLGWQCVADLLFDTYCTTEEVRLPGAAQLIMNGQIAVGRQYRGLFLPDSVPSSAHILLVYPYRQCVMFVFLFLSFWPITV